MESQGRSLLERDSRAEVGKERRVAKQRIRLTVEPKDATYVQLSRLGGARIHVPVGGGGAKTFVSTIAYSMPGRVRTTREEGSEPSKTRIRLSIRARNFLRQFQATMPRLSVEDAVDAKNYAAIVEITRQEWNDRHVLVAGLMAIQQCIDRQKHGEAEAKVLGAVGACELVLDAMKDNMESEEVQFYGAQAFRFLAMSSRNILRFEAKHGLDQLHQSLVHYVSVPRAIREELWTLATFLAASEPSTRRFLEDMDGAFVLLQLLERHLDNQDIQQHGCHCLVTMATRFKSRFRDEVISATGLHLVGLTKRSSSTVDLLVACVRYVTALVERSPAVFFDDPAWFPSLFQSHRDHEALVLELVFLYITLWHASPRHALDISLHGGLDCVKECLALYLNRRAESTVYELLRLVHHVFKLSADDMAILPLVLECQSVYDVHERLQIEVCCIVRLAAPKAGDSLANQRGVLLRLQKLHPTSSILVRECQATLAMLQ
ncbi:unnamed protein product [Aphanomyces euteiches]|nr:hypothetical protein AeRB84_011879 [Aphanomyces euteiches]